MAATQEKSLSQFPTAAQILLTTLLFGSVVDATSSSGYDSVKILVSDLAEAILGDFAYTQDLATDTKTIFGAINSIRVLSGTATPNNTDGANGQIYVKYASADYSVVALYVKLNDAWREISTGGGGGGASVQMGTTEPTAASGSDGDLYVQYDGTTYEVVAMFVKINGAWREIPLGGEVVITPIAVTSQMVTASSTVGSNFEGYRAFDGQSCNISTMQGGWLANANDNTPTLTVDFGTAQSLGRIAIETANNNNPDTTRAVYIEGSNDGTTWENILASDTTASLSFINGSYSEYTFELNDGSYRYFRIRGTQPFFGGSFQYACCFSEITIYDTSSGIPAIADLTDIDLTSPTDGQLLRYNGTSGKWENAGIIDDTTASASSVYSSSKTDTLIAPLTKEKMVVVYAANGARLWIKRLGNTVQVEMNEGSKMSFNTAWANLFTDNTYQTRAYLDSDFIGTANTLHVPIGLVNGHQIVLKIEKTNGAIQIICDTADGIYPQGCGIYTLA